MFDFNRGYENSLESMKLFRYFTEMSHNPISNWSMEFPNIGGGRNNKIDPSQGQPHLLEDLDYLGEIKNEQAKVFNFFPKHWNF